MILFSISITEKRLAWDSPCSSPEVITSHARVLMRGMRSRIWARQGSSLFEPIMQAMHILMAERLRYQVCR